MKSIAEIMGGLPSDWPNRHLLPTAREQQPGPKPRPKEMRSLRDLAGVADAFSDGWDESETGDAP
jgi:hypothetical protein